MTILYDIVPPGPERRACCGYLNQARGLSPLPQGKTTTPNYPLKHARSGSDRVTASTSLLRGRPRRSGPLRSYRGVIFMGFRGPKALLDRVESRSPVLKTNRLLPGLSLIFAGRRPCWTI